MRRLLQAAHAGYVVTGMVLTMLGPLLPILQARWQIDDARAGLLFTAQSIGSISGNLISSGLIRRSGFRMALLCGYGLLLIGVGLLAVVKWPAALLAAVCWGTGVGFILPSTNLLVSEANPVGRSAALNRVNAMWCVGALSCPVLAAVLLPRWPLPALLALLAGLLACVATFLLAAGAAPLMLGTSAIAGEPKSGGAGGGLLLSMLAGLFFLYVGTEQALAGWVAVHAQRSSGGTSGTTWMLAPGVFWGALLAGRLAAPRFFGNWGERLHVLISLCAAACGVIVLIASESSLPVFAGVALCGIGLAPVYAHGVAGIARVFEGEAVRRARVVFAMGGLGGAALPWLVGFLSAKTGGLAAGLWTALAGVAGIACVIVLLERQLKHPR